MSEADEGERPTPRRGSKAGRNEGRKLAATFVNNAALAFFLAAILQPLIAYFRDRQPLTENIWLSTFLLALGAAILAFTAQAIARRLED